MLKMKRVAITIIMAVIICLLFTMTLEVKATGTDGTGTENDPITLGNLDITTDDGSANDTATPSVNTETVNTEGVQIIQPETNTATNDEGELPQTGVTEDITVMFFIVVCIISAIYAYRKIKDYNV